MSTITTKSLQSNKKILEDKYIVYIVGGLIGIFLLIFLALPVLNIIRLSITEYSPKQFEFTGKLTTRNFTNYFHNPSMVQALLNSLWIAVWSMLFTTVFAFIFAYGLTRTTIKWKKALYYIAMIPLIAPSMLQAMALISLFGSNGLITAGLLHTDWNIYGSNGIIVSEILYCFPHAMVILYTTLSAVDSRLDEAAASLGASGWTSFFKITILGWEKFCFVTISNSLNQVIFSFSLLPIFSRTHNLKSVNFFLINSSAIY